MANSLWCATSSAGWVGGKKEKQYFVPWSTDPLRAAARLRSANLVYRAWASTYTPLMRPASTFRVPRSVAMLGTNSPGKYKSLFRLTAFRRQCTSVTHSARLKDKDFLVKSDRKTMV